MAKLYKTNYELSTSDMKFFEKYLDKFLELMDSTRLINYIAKKCEKELKNISVKNLSTISTKEDIESSTYINSNKLEIDYSKKEIILFNDSTIDVRTKNISQEKLNNYPLKLSLAQMVEFGIGYTGSLSANGEVPKDWQYDVNNHGAKGWYYKDNNGNYHWTNGYAGRFIFYKLKTYVEKNISKWIAEFFESNLKG